MDEELWPVTDHKHYWVQCNSAAYTQHSRSLLLLSSHGLTHCTVAELYWRFMPTCGVDQTAELMLVIFIFAVTVRVGI